METGGLRFSLICLWYVRLRVGKPARREICVGRASAVE